MTEERGGEGAITLETFLRENRYTCKYDFVCSVQIEKKLKNSNQAGEKKLGQIL